MSDLANLFPGFASHWINTSVGKMFARTGGSGPPLLCLHGYPQTHVMWHKVAPALAQHFALVLPDLPGYGWSCVPDAKPDHSPYTKRVMASVMIELMEALGHAHFRLAGHDRGGRVAYRLALDHPGRLAKLATLDIVPTAAMWHAMDAKMAMRAWHWTFLAQPFPLPELLLGKAANEYFELLTAKWLAGNERAFDARAIAHYRASFTEPQRIHASCEDYRAGQSTDVAYDEADRAAGRRIACPMLALWGANGLPRDLSPLDVWREWATDVRGIAIDCGHFLCEEAPDAAAAALLEFFTQ
jgi:haloacetate dehalogenase